MPGDQVCALRKRTVEGGKLQRSPTRMHRGEHACMHACIPPGLRDTLKENEINSF